MKRLFKITLLISLATAGWRAWQARQAKSRFMKRDAWWHGSSDELNSTELPATDVARSQHEEPMRHSEAVVDPAHTAH